MPIGAVEQTVDCTEVTVTVFVLFALKLNPPIDDTGNPVCEPVFVALDVGSLWSFIVPDPKLNVKGEEVALDCILEAEDAVVCDDETLAEAVTEGLPKESPELDIALVDVFPNWIWNPFGCVSLEVVLVLNALSVCFEPAVPPNWNPVPVDATVTLTELPPRLTLVDGVFSLITGDPNLKPIPNDWGSLEDVVLVLPNLNSDPKGFDSLFVTVLPNLKPPGTDVEVEPEPPPNLKPLEVTALAVPDETVVPNLEPGLFDSVELSPNRSEFLASKNVFTQLGTGEIQNMLQITVKTMCKVVNYQCLFAHFIEDLTWVLK